MHQEPYEQNTREAGGVTSIDVVRAAYRAFHARDVDALLETFAPDIEWVHPEGMADHGLGGARHGHAGVLAFLRRVPSVIGGMLLEPQEFVASGSRVIVLGTRRVTSLDGRTATLRFVHSWTIRDGKAVRMEDIFDTVAFRRLIDDTPRVSV
ncbi:DUF4440 domain-containing protein [Streptomyces sp. SID4931]|nr:DUF4440 domain-containing protein [Streptomyces sp. SID4931]SCF87661.1 hypothetical protein GA0115255_109679 [Streptomyces sp. Ncost-T6T-2b]